MASANEVLWNKSVNRLETKLSRADEFGVSLLVLHLGSYVDSLKEEVKELGIKCLTLFYELLKLESGILIIRKNFKGCFNGI